MPNFLVLEVENGRFALGLEEIKCLHSIESESEVRSFGNRFCVSDDFSGKYQLSFTKRIGEILGVFENLEDIKTMKLPEGQFYVRVKDLKQCHGTDAEPLIGGLLGGSGRTSFSHPDFVILAYHLDKWYICREIYHRDSGDSNKRRAPLRPFFSPISMDPHFASFLINIGHFKKGSKLLDPFCGGGGILLEAHIKGFETVGVDILNEMVVGARTNMKYYGARNSEIIRGDFLQMHFDTHIDGIVTDFPYGRNSHMSGEAKSMYRDSSKKMAEILASGSRACVVTDSMENLKDFESEFFVDAVFPVRVHKSLTRYYTRLVRR